MYKVCRFIEPNLVCFLLLASKVLAMLKTSWDMKLLYVFEVGELLVITIGFHVPYFLILFLTRVNQYHCDHTNLN